jgi:hypothetical protein
LELNPPLHSSLQLGGRSRSLAAWALHDGNKHAYGIQWKNDRKKWRSVPACSLSASGEFLVLLHPVQNIGGAVREAYQLDMYQKLNESNWNAANLQVCGRRLVSVRAAVATDVAEAPATVTSAGSKVRPHIAEITHYCFDAAMWLHIYVAAANSACTVLQTGSA